MPKIDDTAAEEKTREKFQAEFDSFIQAVENLQKLTVVERLSANNSDVDDVKEFVSWIEINGDSVEMIQFSGVIDSSLLGLVVNKTVPVGVQLASIDVLSNRNKDLPPVDRNTYFVTLEDSVNDALIKLINEHKAVRLEVENWCNKNQPHSVVAGENSLAELVAGNITEFVEGLLNQEVINEMRSRLGAVLPSALISPSEVKPTQPAKPTASPTP